MQTKTARVRGSKGKALAALLRPNGHVNGNANGTQLESWSFNGVEIKPALFFRSKLYRNHDMSL